MEISAKMVKELRETTNCGMMDCKKALAECDGDMEKAVEYLRKKGIASAAKKEGRATSQGIVGSYIHMGGKVGVLVEVNCETDFVARGEDFQTFLKDIAMHIAAMSPQYLSKEDVPESALAKEREIELERLKNDEAMAKKPADVLSKIVDGRLSKYYETACLLEQPFVKDQSSTVGELVKSLTAKIGEKVAIRRFTRYKMGEGLEKKEGDFGAEVAEMLNR